MVEWISPLPAQTASLDVQAGKQTKHWLHNVLHAVYRDTYRALSTMAAWPIDRTILVYRRAAQAHGYRYRN